MRGFAWVLLLAAAGPAPAAVLTTKEAVLEEQFPGATFERARSFLSEAEAARVGEAAGTKLQSRAVLAWRALDGETLLGTAYLERHRVRTLPESILVMLSPAGAVLRIEVLTFDGVPLVSVYENPRVRRRREAQAARAEAVEAAQETQETQETQDAQETEDAEDAEDVQPASGHLEGRPGAIRDTHRLAPADVDPRLDLDD